LTEKLPWFPSLILAVLAWTVTHIVDRVNQTPALEYRVSRDNFEYSKTITVYLTNITRDTDFTNVIIVLQNTGDMRKKCTREKDVSVSIDCPNITPFQPADDGGDAPSIDETSVSFIIPKMMPGSIYKITSSYTGKEIPRIRISSSSSTIRITQRTIETIFAKNEIIILIAMVLFWIFTLFITINKSYFTSIYMHLITNFKLWKSRRRRS
jgi:hypothetical protein